MILEYFLSQAMSSASPLGQDYESLTLGQGLQNNHIIIIIIIAIIISLYAKTDVDTH